jgi:hypothetical protein
MDSIVFWAFAAALNPTLLAATTVMLLLPSPKKLLLGYLLGAMLTSITLGMVIVFSLHGSSAESTAKSTLSPGTDLALGVILLLIAYALKPREVPEEPHHEGRLARRRRRRKEAKEAKDKPPPRWQRTLGKGDARATFVVGALLTLPGGSYLVGLDHIADQDASTAATVAMVLGFNLIMLMLLELPLLAYTFAPDRTPDAVARFRDWLNRNGRRVAVRGALVLGVLLIARGVFQLLT